MQNFTIESVAELGGHTDCVWDVAWNPEQPLLASCSADKAVRLASYSQSHEFANVASIPTGHTRTVRAIAWAPSGKTLATASFDSSIGIWEREPDGDWECTSTLEGHETEVKGVAYSSSGTMLATCSRDKSVWIWEVHPDSDFECMSVLIEHTQDVKCVAWHPTEEILASASYDDTIKLYIDDPSDDWYNFSTLSGHASTVWSLAFSPCGRYLASGSDDRSVRIWRRVEARRWECALVLADVHERSVYSVSWGRGAGSPELGWLASAGGDGKINVWQLEDASGKLRAVLMTSLDSAHGVSDINAIAWCSRTGFETVFATGGDDHFVRVWKVSSTESSAV